jgi:hypothetical protein
VLDLIVDIVLATISALPTHLRHYHLVNAAPFLNLTSTHIRIYIYSAVCFFSFFSRCLLCPRFFLFICLITVEERAVFCFFSLFALIVCDRPSSWNFALLVSSLFCCFAVPLYFGFFNVSLHLFFYLFNLQRRCVYQVTAIPFFFVVCC